MKLVHESYQEFLNQINEERWFANAHNWNTLLHIEIVDLLTDYVTRTKQKSKYSKGKINKMARGGYTQLPMSFKNDSSFVVPYTTKNQAFID